MNKFISHIVAQTNLYSSQNGRNFVTNDAEMKAFLGMNSIMSFNKLPLIEHCWSTDNYIGNQGLGDVMTKSRFKEILHNIHFSDNDTADSNNNGNIVRPLIGHFNEAFQNAMANSPNQSIDGLMIKFKGRSSMKQCLKSKPIKWGLKFWFRCDSKTGYLYEFDIYLGCKESTEYNLRESVVLNLATSLNDSYCTLLFGNFFSSPNLIKNCLKKIFTTLELSEQIGKTCQHFHQTKISKEVIANLKHKNVICVKWMDNRAVTLIGSNIGNLNQML